MSTHQSSPAIPASEITAPLITSHCIVALSVPLGGVPWAAARVVLPRLARGAGLFNGVAEGGGSGKCAVAARGAA